MAISNRLNAMDIYYLDGQFTLHKDSFIALKIFAILKYYQ